MTERSSPIASASGGVPSPGEFTSIPLRNRLRLEQFVILPEEWLPDTDVLTPTAKLKRRGIHARYASEIKALYAD